jgi:hypothetical protein
MSIINSPSNFESLLSLPDDENFLDRYYQAPSSKIKVDVKLSTSHLKID